MYIIVIGWLYVTVLMALTEDSIVAGVLSLTFYGLLPTALLLWLFGGPIRRRRAARAAWLATSEDSGREGATHGTGDQNAPDR